MTTLGSPTPRLGFEMRTMFGVRAKPTYSAPLTGSSAVAVGWLPPSPSVGRRRVAESMVSVAWLKCRRKTPRLVADQSGTYTEPVVASNDGWPGVFAVVLQAVRPATSTRQKPSTLSEIHRWPGLPAGPGSHTPPLGAVTGPAYGATVVAADAPTALNASKSSSRMAAIGACLLSCLVVVKLMLISSPSSPPKQGSRFMWWVVV